MNTPNPSQKIFDLEERTYSFARSIRTFLSSLRPNESNYEDKKQLVRSSGSVAANYIEANEELGTKDFAMRRKITRKEAKESVLWLKLMKDNSTLDYHGRIDEFIQEGLELVRVFSSIIQKLK